jgi:hypothetical protein
MPLEISASAPTILLRRDAFERIGLNRLQFDERWNLTPDEFRVEGSLIAIGPLHGEHDIGGLVAELEELGLGYFDDFFELTGNWPDWMRVLVLAGRQLSADA